MATVMSDKSTIIRKWDSLLDLPRLHQHNPARYPYLLASTSRTLSDAGRLSSPDRYDVLMGFPQSRLQKWPGDNNNGNFLDSLDTAWRQAAIDHLFCETDLPFTGGWFVYLGYELAQEIEPSLQLPLEKHSSIPTAMAVRIPLAIINDRYEHTAYLVCEAEYAELLEVLLSDIDLLVTQHNPVDKPVTISLQEDAPQRFVDGVARVKSYIHEGDVFQVNLSRHWSGCNNDNISPLTIFRRLTQTNPAPYAGLACFEHGAIISSSPERLVCVRHNRVETRPIAGTRPRGKDTESDRHNLQELIGHPKERAEHVMLIDLERNDLGRICRPGSIEVNELMVLESYAHVHHIVSNVRGELKPGVTPGEVIRAVFPGGTITGCPKVRCMAIIAELEQQARGPYTGAMGYLNHSGDMDLNILIRTIVLDQDGISFRAGAGLVADSIAEHELQETRAKAKGMLLSLQGALGQ